MRGLLYILSIASVVALAYWAYHQGYETRQTAREVAQLQRDLGKAHERLAVLKAEWAYQNRPDRLRVLAEMNFERLGLMPLAADQFGSVTQISYPPASSLPQTYLAGLGLPSDAELSDIQTLSDADSRLIAPEPYAPQPEALP